MVEIQFECEENDNHICVVLNEADNLEEIRVAPPPGTNWTVVGATDLREALWNSGYAISRRQPENS